jgi:two-component system, chemotaxis family, protein-glutamate methylesterase/glutaminase
MPRIRVLVVDDSVVIRKMLMDVLSEDPDIEVVGVAANGKIALSKIPQTNPDLLTMDIEMPEMNGLETLKALRATYPKLPVIMFSTLTERGATATLEALTLGATDYVTKPANVGSVTTAIARIREQLLPKIRTLSGKMPSHIPGVAGLARKGPALPFTIRPAAVQPAGARVDVVCIGVSTGGPNALLEMMPTFPADFPVPILIVQHMPPVFTRALADRLSAKSRIRVAEAKPGDIAAPGTAWVAPGGFHLTARRSGVSVVLDINEDPPENSCRPAVDVLFRSVAQVFGVHSLGVVLTGMGQDGLRGCEDIKGAGGEVFVQDEASSVVWGMPGYVANAALADRVLPLSQMGIEIVRRIERDRIRAAAPAEVTS